MFLLFLCWGSFLNVLGYRLLYGHSLLISRSFCPSCNSTIAWYDLVPVLSWLFLRGNCRTCKTSISWLYPFIELLTALSLTALYLTVPLAYFPAYFVLFSILIVTIRTDLQEMLIVRYMTLWVIPLGLLFSFTGCLPISLLESILGAIMGYSILWLVKTVYYFFKKVEGMGEGDLELLAVIGAFTGPVGCWLTVMIGSIFGSLIGILLILITKKSTTLKIPFGPFLALGAMLYVLFQNQIVLLLF